MESFDMSAMDTTFPAELAEVIDLHNEMFAGWKMQLDDADANAEAEVEADDADDATEADEEADTDPEDDDAEIADPEGAEALGDPGKKALDSMKAKLREERKLRREAERKLRDAAKPDTDPALAEALAKANRRILRSEVKAAAKGKLSDPSDAFKFIDFDDFEVTDDGEVDEDEIADAIEELIREKPYLAATTAQGRRFSGTADQGVKKQARLRQFTRDDLKSMSPEQIIEAQAKGQLSDLLKNK